MGVLYMRGRRTDNGCDHSPPLMPMMVPLRPRGTEKLSLTLTTRSNRWYSASGSGTTPCCCSKGWRERHTLQDSEKLCVLDQYGDFNVLVTHYMTQTNDYIFLSTQVKTFLTLKSKCGFTVTRTFLLLFLT